MNEKFPCPAKDEAILPVHVGMKLSHIPDDLVHAVEFDGQDFGMQLDVMVMAESLLCDC